jgi:hypothetical protein
MNEVRIIMAYDPGMIQPKRKQPAAPEIETDLLRIQQLSQEHDDENLQPGLEGLVHSCSNRLYFAQLACMGENKLRANPINLVQ